MAFKFDVTQAIKLRGLPWMQPDPQLAHKRLEVLLNGSEDEKTGLKKSQMDLCQFVGLTAALFASVAATSLQSPSLPQTHWSVRAVWTVTMVFSVLSAFSAYFAFTALSRLRSTGDIVGFYAGVPEHCLRRWLSEQTETRRIYELGFMGPVLISDYLSLPGQLLNYSLITYLLGLGLSCLLPFTVPSTSEGTDSDRNVFIFFILGLGLSLSFIILSRVFLSINRTAYVKRLKQLPPFQDVETLEAEGKREETWEVGRTND
ncbi:hypothetical protein QBC47DRAFT_381399 [Echria macrotheca]|uniref:Uncharacterized protein n=1 Tax=Echria macrotheca TaxID=438768 RepID=A0AAJ0BD41_9PEZI|nr:hypothetical protein QBC47DRAFT_381399 [Echria macrotheca]